MLYFLEALSPDWCGGLWPRLCCFFSEEDVNKLKAMWAGSAYDEGDSSGCGGSDKCFSCRGAGTVKCTWYSGRATYGGKPKCSGGKVSCKKCGGSGRKWAVDEKNLDNNSSLSPQPRFLLLVFLLFCFGTRGCHLTPDDGAVHFKGSRKLERVAAGGEALEQLIIHNVKENEQEAQGSRLYSAE